MVRADKKRVEIETKRTLGFKNLGDDAMSVDSGVITDVGGGDDRRNRLETPLSPSGGVSGHPLRPAPVGVLGVPFDVDSVEDESGDILICSTEGHDFSLLELHGLGELTTLLFNSVANLAIGDVIYDDRHLRNTVSESCRGR